MVLGRIKVRRIIFTFFSIIIFLLFLYFQLSKNPKFNIKENIYFSLQKTCLVVDYEMKFEGNSLTKPIPFDSFEWPLDIDIHHEISKLKSGLNTTYCPINDWRSTFSKYLLEPSHLNVSPFLLLVVKSKDDHFGFRDVLRKFWAKRGEITIDNQKFRVETIFVMARSGEEKINQKLKVEQENYGDLLQMSFYDRYNRSCMKLLATLHWLHSRQIHQPEFYFFTDDDMYISINNLLNTLISIKSPTETTKLSEVYMGKVYTETPARNPKSKWYVNLQLYPFKMYPPYIPAGAFILSQSSAYNFYVASQFKRVYPFDDVMMGILAHSLNIKPQNIEHFYLRQGDTILTLYQYLKKFGVSAINGTDGEEFFQDGPRSQLIGVHMYNDLEIITRLYEIFKSLGIS